MGLEAKTDRVDARLIARYGEVMRPTATPLPDPARQELREILACRRQLIDRSPCGASSSSTCRARPSGPGSSGRCSSCARRPRRSLALLRERIAADRTSPPTSPCSPGCPAAARSSPPPCWPRCPSWHPRPPKVAALAGLAPVARDSGLRETAGSSRAAAARSAAPSTWPPSPASRPTKPPESPLRPAPRKRQATQARPRRPHAHHARHPQRHAQEQSPLDGPKAKVTATTVAEPAGPACPPRPLAPVDLPDIWGQPQPWPAGAGRSATGGAALAVGPAELAALGRAG